MTAVEDPDLQIREPRSSRPRHKGWGGGGLNKKFSALLASVWFKNKGGAPPRPLPWIHHWTGMLRPVSCDKWKPPQDWHIMRLVLKVPALETVGRMYSSFLPKGKENPQGYWYTKNSLGPLPWIRHWTGMLRPVSSHKWKPPQDRHIMRLPPNVPALETVGRMYSSFFLPREKKTCRDTDI